MLPRRPAAPWLLSYALVGGTFVTDGCVAVLMVSVCVCVCVTSRNGLLSVWCLSYLYFILLSHIYWCYVGKVNVICCVGHVRMVYLCVGFVVALICIGCCLWDHIIVWEVIDNHQVLCFPVDSMAPIMW